MPLYEYECSACGHRFERIQKFSDSPVEVCPNCGEPRVQKLLSSPAIQFKGTGWYITDYARKGEAATDAKGATPADSSKETKSTDAKTTSDASAPASSSSTPPSTPKASGE